MNLSEKRRYHPFIPILYFAGCLDEKYIKQIPVTTIQYWKQTDHQTLYGFDWVKDVYTDFEKNEKRAKETIIKKSINICSRIIFSFTTIFANVPSQKKVFKKNIATIIKTIDRIMPDITLGVACKIFKISTNQYYRWKNKLHCTASVLNLCFRTHTNQLTIKENMVIYDALHAPENCYNFLSSTFLRLKRNGQLYCSLSTFYKYAFLHSVHRLKHKKITPNNSFRATKVFEYIHIDTTFVLTELEGKCRVVFVKDNYSKAILHGAIVPAGNSSYIRDVLIETFNKHGIRANEEAISIVSDGGSENAGEVLKWIANNEQINVVKIIAKKDNSISNNMVESCNHIFKNVFMAGKIPKNSEDLKIFVEQYKIFHNQEWFPIEFYGLNPEEVLTGTIPDKNKFKEQTIQAVKSRAFENKRFDSEHCITCQLK